MGVVSKKDIGQCMTLTSKELCKCFDAKYEPHAIVKDVANTAKS